LAQEAELLMRQAAEHDGEQRLALARFLGQRWRCEDALQYCAEAWEQSPAESVAATCVDVLRTGRPSPDQIQRVRSWIEDAAAKAPDSAELHFQLANVAHLQADYSSAERLYRRTLEVAPNSIVTQNELALLIALNGGDAGEASRLINAAIEAAGPLPFLLDTRATISLAMGRTAEAVKDLRQAIADAPTAAKHFHLAQALLAEENKAGAKTEFQNGVAAGLHAGSLHPLERAAYDDLQAQMKQL
jgi:tetratricopeptide (TPR) repeat protein